MISKIMADYKTTLETLTKEVTNLCSEIADKKVQFNNRKKLNHNQVTMRQDFDQQLKEHNKQNQQQQNTLRGQLKQQIN